MTTEKLSSKSGDQVGVRISYRNRDTEPCSLTGYPGASAVNGSGAVLADARRSPSGLFEAVKSGVTLPGEYGITPDGVVYAVIEWGVSDFGQGSCVTASDLLSTPPDTTATSSLGISGRLCDLQVHPLISPEEDAVPSSSYVVLG